MFSQLPEIPGYEIKTILGRGGIGIVYLARHVVLRRSVALKMLLSGEYASALELTRFLREARSVASLRHPNIVQIHDVGDLDGRPFYTMELIEGGTLVKKLSGVPLPAREAASLIRVLAQAVDVAHQAGIVHRDLKPANILLTSDGAPKISDFGLARHLDESPSLTITGARMGTPSYMSPEQASGSPDAISASVDIYALGAILYEMLTGRPPFRAETAVETERQVISQDPVPPSRLNAKVPRDLETICLKCLSKAPRRRYENAAGMARDLHRYLLGEPVTARRTGAVERLAKWAKRHPAFTTGTAAAVLLATALISALIHSQTVRARHIRAAEIDLKEFADLEAWGQWPQAQAALSRAKARFDDGEPSEISDQLNSAQRDLALVQNLDAIRMTRATTGGLPFYRSEADQEYLSAFKESGIPATLSPLDAAAARIQKSPIRAALVSALDDWSVTTADPPQSPWLLELARRTDPAPRPREDHLRDPTAWSNLKAVNDLAQTVSVDGNSISAYLALAERTQQLGGDSAGFLGRAQKEHPADFWINLGLGNALLFRDPYDAGNYYRAALAARPESAVAYNAVGDALHLQGQTPEAIQYYRKALSFDPNYPQALTGLGNALRETGHAQDAADSFEKSLQVDPDYSWAHVGLGTTLAELGQFDQAIHHFSVVPASALRNPDIESAFRGILIRQGHGEEALAQWKQVFATSPMDFREVNGYAELCLYLGHEQDYHDACAVLLKRYTTSSESRVLEPVARTCLLLPLNAQQAKQATSLAGRAVRIDGSRYDYYFAYSMFAKGLSDYRLGNLDAAISIMKNGASGVMGPCPGLVAAMALHDQGNNVEATKLLAAAVTQFEWCPGNADQRDFWIYHILRREAEAKILPNLQELVNGKAQPKDNDERIALTGYCQFHHLEITRAHLFADAFTTDPALTGAADPDLFFQAGCAAAMGADGRSADAAALKPADPIALREQALRWLNADLAIKASRLILGNRASCERLRNDLRLWRSIPNLSSIRDESELQKMLPEERGKFAALWKSVNSKLTLLENAN